MKRILMFVVLFMALAATSFAVPKGKSVVFGGKGAGEVVFDGTAHAGNKMACNDCHPMFKMKKGANPVTKKDMVEGGYCGKCHDGSRAFAVNNPAECSKCHRGSGYLDSVAAVAGSKPRPSAREPINTDNPSVSSDVDELPAATFRGSQTSYAVVIGVERYRQKLPNAAFADGDARIVTAYLTRVLGYPEENVVTLLNDFAAKSDFEKYFERWLPNNVEPGSSVFVYYSGHGAPNPRTGDAYLVPYDGDPSFIDETGYSLKRMYAALGKLPAKEVIVALDSCFSGAGGRSVLAKGARPLVMNLKTAAPAKNMTILAASSGEQISSTYDEKGHGLFTYFMLKGIKDEDVVKTDGSLDISTLFDYIKPHVSSIARKKFNNEQTPQLIEAKK